MAFNNNLEKPIRFEQRPVTIIKRLVSSILILCGIGALFYIDFGRRHVPIASWILLGFSVLLIFIIWMLTRNDKKIQYLILYSKGIKLIKFDEEYDSSWNEMQLIQQNTNIHGNIISLSILMLSGRLWILSGYKDMHAIAEYAGRHVKSGKLSGMLKFISKMQSIEKTIVYSTLILFVVSFTIIQLTSLYLLAYSIGICSLALMILIKAIQITNSLWGHHDN